MRRLLSIVVVVAMLFMVGCGRKSSPRILSLGVVDTQWPIGGGEWPLRIIVEAEVENPRSAIKLIEGRVRVGYEGRRAVVFTLEDKVRIAPRRTERVVLPLRMSVSRSSQTLDLREALRQHRAEGIELDWSVAVRSGIGYARIEQEPTPISSLLSPEQQELLWQGLEQMFKE